MRKCAGCKQELPLEEFTKDAKQRDGLSRLCRDCKKERWRRFSRDNPNSQYRLRRGEIKRLKERDGDYCQGCGDRSDLVVDHDHADGATRGLLCKVCNSGLGMLKDDVQRLRNLADYLERHAERMKKET